MTSDIGLVGIGVMGRNLALNFADQGATVSVYNRTRATTDEFVAAEGDRPDIVPTHTIDELVSSLERPRRVVVMVPAGSPVDSVIGQLQPLLERGDIVIDGGNSLYTDTGRRTAELAESGIHFVGCGISGGEEGARYGPSMMPGGAEEAWPHISELFQAAAAKAPDGTPCADWLGPDGVGHYVKMVHNGIEYGDMQVIAEAYHLLYQGVGMSHDEMAAVFREWDKGVLDSFLIEITADILALEVDGERRLEAILDAAGQKGTGKWTVISSMELGQPTTLVAEAVYARIVSAFKGHRLDAAQILQGPKRPIADTEGFVEAVHKALYASKIVSYAQGFMQMRAASEENDWDLDLGRVAKLWTAGCIIRARFLDDITDAFSRDPENLMVDPFFRDALADAQDGWRRVVRAAVEAGLPVPAYATALAFYDAFRRADLPANLIQAQRDYFGAHTYERRDRPRGEFFHTHWTEGGAEEPA
ncbi:MAG TPA: decarboxylating NADP(+)-dependent phosphogluconate dehydrogenase [Acidimicrobiia bacterium]|nr:decarboxylating NADP(+)-dependent phosphogluconate dehydrogenase [Acidimicrobiia bacterium]